MSALAADFTAEADAVRSQTKAFEADAIQVGEAFGLLGICDGALDKYTQLVESTAKGLGQLAEVLDNEAEGIRASLQNYQALDQAVADHFCSIVH